MMHAGRMMWLSVEAGSSGSENKNCARESASLGPRTYLLMTNACTVQCMYSCSKATLEVWSLLVSCDTVSVRAGGRARPKVNEFGHTVLKRFKFLLKHSHFKHYCEMRFPDQAEYILQRKTVLAMSLHPSVGRHSFFLFWTRIQNDR